MDRRDFLTALGLGGAAIACAQCLGGCNPGDNGITGPSNVDFTLNLDDPANSALKSVGGYVYHGGVIVARTAGGYVALSQQCTHQGTTVYYDAGINRFVCPSHGSTFNTGGGVTGGPAPTPLTTYHTTLSGSSLRVKS